MFHTVRVKPLSRQYSSLSPQVTQVLNVPANQITGTLTAFNKKFPFLFALGVRKFFFSKFFEVSR